MDHRAAAALVTMYATLLNAGAHGNALNSYRRLYDTKLRAMSTAALADTEFMASAEACAKTCSRTEKLDCRAFNYDRFNGVCWLLESTSRSPGVTVHYAYLTDLYERKEYVRECFTGNGSGYRGDRNRTKSGVPCQAWGDSEPHDSWYLPQYYSAFGLEGSSCRNPSLHAREPWCYTTDIDLRHEACGIPRCDEVPCVECRGERYRGLVDFTASERECQRWDTQHPHRHNFTPDRFPNAGLDDNYCRNPNGFARPWCLTTDPHYKWEYCNIATCSTQPVVEGRPCVAASGEDYRGQADRTEDGIPCQPWDAQHPHRHTFSTRSYPCSGLERNYCRNPNGSAAPWCFTVDPRVRVGVCSHIPRCAEPTPLANQEPDCYSGTGTEYRGSVATTRHGLWCQAWNVTFPHKPWYTPKSHPAAGLEGHSCRNPDGDPWGPWCFTSDPHHPWDYCSVNSCDGYDLHRPNTTIAVPSRRRDCGWKYPQITVQVRIVGGWHHASPWTVSLRNREKQHFCGGTLVDEQWVLSVQDCFSSWLVKLGSIDPTSCTTGYKHNARPLNAHGNASGLEAWLGDVKEKSGARERRVQTVPFSRLFCGPHGSKLVMLKLSKKVELNNHVATICLPDPSKVLDPQIECEISGWGDTQGTRDAGLLKVASVSLVDDETCGQLHNRRIRHREICAGKGDRSGDSCEKDYGGPLACVDNGQFVLQGIMPPGRRCGLSNLPGVHIRVSHYLHWIHKIVRSS